MLENISLNTIFSIVLIFCAPIIGGFLMGIDRKLTARMQSRMGPPIIQPFYDVIKLWGKEPFISSTLQPILAFCYFGFSLTSFALLALGQDLLLIIFTLGIADSCLIIASLNSKSPYSVLGGKRELLSIMSYEPVLLLTAISIYYVTGSFMVARIFYLSYPLISYLPLVFIALIPVLVIDLKKSPYDVSASGHAHQELVRGVFTEFSGYSLALIELGHWTKVVMMLSLVSLFWATNLIIGICLALVLFFIVLVIDNVYPRLDWKSMLKTTWSIGIILIIANIVGLIARVVMHI
ncbi:NADH-quinone oxidoreductase subunit H [Candidatus Bathyarchaeota archaeon]|nr:NADH-quinone oxidoreductase subunit H [Candidatus Bathyarchaeota archaeon]